MATKYQIAFEYPWEDGLAVASEFGVFPTYEAANEVRELIKPLYEGRDGITHVTVVLMHKDRKPGRKRKNNG